MAGIAAGLAFTTKFQVVAFLPLLAVIALALNWRYLVRSLVAFSATVAVLIMPFAMAGQAKGVLHAYEEAVSAYRVVSYNAFNLWYLLFGSAAARSSDISPLGGSGLTYKIIGLAIYALGVAGLLSIVWQKIRREPDHNVVMVALQAAAISALLFFLLPTEMHERYAYPYIVFGCLPAAVAGGRSLAVYFLLAIAIALNIAHSLTISITDAGYASFPEAGRAIALGIIVLTVVATALFLRSPSNSSQPTLQT